MRPKFAILFLLLSSLSWADGLQSTKFTTTGQGTSILLSGTGAQFHKLTWNKSGTVSACSVRADSSSDGITWNSGDVIAAQDCSSNGASSITNLVANYVRVNVTSFTGSGTVIVAYNLYNDTPVLSITACSVVANNFITGYDTAGACTKTQPSAANLSNGTTGSGNVVLADTPTLITPNLGVASATSLVTTTGSLTVGSTLDTTSGLSVYSIDLTGTDQTGGFFNPIGTSSATGSVVGVYGLPQTAATSFTTSNAVALYAGNPIKGAGSTITTAIGLNIENITSGATNYAIKGGTGRYAFSGDVETPHVQLSATDGAIRDQSGNIMGATLKKGSGGGNYTNATTTYAVADSTNLCGTFTIPTGWKLVVHASGNLGTSTAVVAASAALTDNSSCATANAGVLTEAQTFANAAGNTESFALNYVITGDGASHKVALQFKTSNGADTANLINSSSTFLPTMVFTLLPSN